MACDRFLNFNQASAFTSFHRKLAVLIEPYLDRQWTMADVGCGLALLDFEIADKVRSIDAIDIDEAIVKEIDSHIDCEAILGHNAVEKIHPRLLDSTDLGDQTWDIVLASFYGKSLSELDELIGHAKHRAIFILHGRRPNGRFDPYDGDSGEITAEELEPYLVQQGYRFKKTVAELQFGQPFKTIEDIHNFLARYKAQGHSADAVFKIPPVSEMPFAEFDAENHMLSTEERIIKTDRYDFPFYLPNNFCVGIFAIVK
ncbi:MAG: class I SAM-dependent methyltransferase [Clostridiales Family XIII bacterium]|jgi:hypothetical protein|nr:class I SAM-dependent methyltransferase [Clostridiales Family XIII bacterium]